MYHSKTTAAEIISSDIKAINRDAAQELDRLAGKEVLITGGAGFLGYLLVHLLAQIGDNDGREPINLTVYENFSRGRKLWLDKLAKRSNVKVIEHDITKPLPLHMPEFSYIIHAASIASPIYYRLNPIKTIDANINGLRNLLDYAKMRSDEQKPISGILFFSTSEIYGDPSSDAIPTVESYRGFVSCTGPRACYDESKRLGETLCVNFAQQYGLPIMIARPFNNYGPGLDIKDRRLLPDLARDIFSNRDIVLLSDGNATRTFCYVSDAITGYIKILINGRPGESYNIGTETPEISVSEFTSKVAIVARSLFGYDGRVVYKESEDKDYLTDNPNRRCPNINKARIELGYAPVVSLDDGVYRSLIWYKDNQ